MALQDFLDNCAFTAQSSGTGDFVDNAAVIGGTFQRTSAANAVDGRQYSYKAYDGTDWEVGYGSYTASTKTLTRNPRANSLGTTAKISFTNAPVVFITLLAEDLSGRILLSSGKITSAVAAVTMALPSGYSKFKLEFWHLDVSARAAINLVFSSDGGSTYYNSSTDYMQGDVFNWAPYGVALANASSLYVSTQNNGFPPLGFYSIDFTPGDGSAQYPHAYCVVGGQSTSTQTDLGSTVGYLNHLVVANYAKIFPTSANLVGGSYRLYGIP